ADVHGRALAHGFHTAEDLDRIGVIVAGLAVAILAVVRHLCFLDFFLIGGFCGWRLSRGHPAPFHSEPAPAAGSGFIAHGSKQRRTLYESVSSGSKFNDLRGPTIHLNLTTK